MDPWGCETISTTVASSFEDNFKPEKPFDKLEDSEEYLAVLGWLLRLIYKILNINYLNHYYFSIFLLLYNSYYIHILQNICVKVNCFLKFFY